jgi:hypothetical protein
MIVPDVWDNIKKMLIFLEKYYFMRLLFHNNGYLKPDMRFSN